MKMLITSTSEDAAQLLEKCGYLAQPTDEENVYHFLVESVEELFHLVEILGFEIIVKGTLDKPMLEIYNDYRE